MSLEKKISFFFRILEQNLMTYARQMFFMTLLYDTELEVPDKAQMYLEIFGNTQLSAKAFQVYTCMQDSVYFVFNFKIYNFLTFCSI